MKEYLKKIEQINFGLMSPSDIRKMSVVTVETPDTYGDDGFPIEKGLMDPRMGVVDPSLVCGTCGFRGGDCQGHFGSIELARPVIHIGFVDVIHKILRSTCNHCGRVLLSEAKIEEFTEKITEAIENREDTTEILKKLQTETKKVEMSEAKLDEIVKKIMAEVYPEEDDEYDNADREEVLLNILDHLYAEAYLKRDETEEYPQFKYIDPKLLCPHCKKNQSIEDIEKSYEIIETNNADELKKIHDKVAFDIEEEFEKKIQKINKRIAKLEEIPEYGEDNEIDFEAIGELNEEKARSTEDFEEKFDYKVFKEYKKYINQYIKQYLKNLIQEPILLDKPYSIRQGDYRFTPSEAKGRLENISDEDLFILGVNPEVARPEWIVLTVLPVPPVTVRPSITLETGERSEDDLTHKLVDILRINQRLLENMEAGAPHLIVEDLWELLQYHVTTYFDNEAGGVPPARHRSGRPLITLMQRFNGHKKDAIHDESRGRIREHLSGKRVNFSARTVMSPDSNIGINEVGVPEMIAKEVTVPVYVNEWNIDEMKKYVQNGPDIHPGANYVIRTDGRKIQLRTDETKKLLHEQLEPGFIIERHLKEGDIVLLNRYPSLHKLSLMAHEVRILPYKTFRINPAVCPPYNVDFDGDEMNIHVLQNVEAQSEAKSLMFVQDNIMSPRYGGPIIGAIRDHISGSYLLTRSESLFSEEDALQIIRKSGLEMPILEDGKWILKKDPAFGDESYIFKEKGSMWTGKELFSLTLPNDLNMSFLSNISNSYILKSLDDAKVIIKNGILVQGVIDEVAIGSNDGKILNKIFRNYGSKQAREFLEKAINLSIATFMKVGITNSINDYEVPKEAQNSIDELLNNKLEEVEDIIKSYEQGHIKTLPGIPLEETLDNKIFEILNEARDIAGKIAEDYFYLHNGLPFSLIGRHSSIMAHAGEKSSMLNITQISSCIGQQAVRGQSLKRIYKERGYEGRLLPHFKKGELNAKSRGFIKSSFLKGLDPIEFFFHAIGGRDSMVDKSIRTSISGYMQRRLINALQDLHTDKNGVVKDVQGNVIQILYGEDGVDPVKSDFSKVVDLENLIEEIRKNSSELDKNAHNIDDIFEKLYIEPLIEFMKNTEDASQEQIKEELLKLDPILQEFYYKHTDIIVDIIFVGERTLDDLRVEVNNFLKNRKFDNSKLKNYSDIKNNLESLIDEYDNLIFKLERKIDEIDEKLTGELVLLMYEIRIKREELYKFFIDDKYLDKNNNVSKLIKENSIFLKNSEKEYSKKLKDINFIKQTFDIFVFNEKIDERKRLFNKIKKQLRNLEEHYLNCEKELINLNNDVKQLTDFPYDKNKLFNEIKSISNEISEYLNIISNLKSKLNKYYDIDSDSIDVIENSIDNINETYGIYKNIKWQNFEGKIENQQKLYESYLNKEKKLNESPYIKKLLSEFNHCLNNPFLSHDLLKFNLTKENLDSIKEIIIQDIIDEKITGENINFKLVLISYCEEYTMDNHRLSDDELDNILSKIDFNNFDDSIIEECKSKVKDDYESNKITKDQIPIKFNALLNKKMDELRKLEELDEIKCNPDLPDVKKYLSEDDCIFIYGLVEEKICSEFGLRGSVFSYVENQMNRKNEKNKSEAREEFKRFRYNRNYFLEITNLQAYQIEPFVSAVELLIGENKIKTDDFDEEFIQKLSLSYKTYGRIIL